MSIKEILKDNGFTLKRFADDLLISRPTLDAYIREYEDGGKISREKYQIIFDNLFGKDLEETDFVDAYESLTDLLHRDEKIGVLDFGARATDVYTNLLETVKSDISKGDYSEQIYFFVNMLINCYRNNNLWIALAEYFALINSEMDIDMIRESQKGYYAIYYNTFRHFLNDPEAQEYDKDDYLAFVERCRELKNDRLKKTKKVEDSFNKRVKLALNSLSEKGIHPEDIHEEQIVAELLKQIEEKRE